jgi:hypothetical protein
MMLRLLSLVTACTLCVFAADQQADKKDAQASKRSDAKSEKHARKGAKKSADKSDEKDTKLSDEKAGSRRIVNVKQKE